MESSNAPLLATKLFVPRTRQKVTQRQRLFERLDAVYAHALTLVSAPAGFGKSTLVGAWVGVQSQPVGWLSLDEADNDPTRFFRYLLAALQQVDATIGRSLAGAFEAPQPPNPNTLVAAIVNDVAQLNAEVLVVLDDFQNIESSVIHESLRDLVAHPPPQLHLVIVTREDPQLPLARMRARGELLELRAQDLRFTPLESASFMTEVMGIQLASRAMADLDLAIEGWIAGLQLAALSMQHRSDPEALIAGLTGNHHYIMGYLTDEVMQDLSPAQRDFLVRTSVLGRLNGALCDAVTGGANGATMLDELYSSNVFVVPLDDDHQWYRYHHLFADILRGQLQHNNPDLVRTLHLRASTWYETSDMAQDAIEHAFSAQDYVRVVALLELHARPVILQGYAQTVEQWIRRLPAEWQVAGPRANLAFAWSLLLSGKLGEIERYLANAELGAGTNTAIESEVLGLRAGLLSLRGNTEAAVELAKSAVALAPVADHYALGMALFCLGTAYNYAGDVAYASEMYERALPLCNASQNTVASMLAISNLSLLHIVGGRLRAAHDLCAQFIAAEERKGIVHSPPLATVFGAYADTFLARNELESALTYAQKSMWVSEHGGHIAAVTYVRVLLSRILLARGDLAGARQAMEWSIPLEGRGMPRWVVSEITAQKIAVALAHDDDATADMLLTQSGIAFGDPIGHADEVIHIARVRLLLHQGRHGQDDLQLEQAHILAGRVIATAEPAGRMGHVLETLILRSLVAYERGNNRGALDDIERALRIAAPEGYIRVFIAEGQPIVQLLRAVREPAVRAYAATLLRCLPSGETTSKPAPATLIEPLTERELEVLRWMAAGLTYDEIARRLVVSLNTVRFHVKGIYGKLGVDRRTNAIQRGAELGLL